MTGPIPRPTRRVRGARPGDVPAIHGLVHELAAYEREPQSVEASEADLRAALFTERPLVHALVAEVDDGGTPEVVGMALWFVSYSTWRGRHGVWLEDLYVRPAARGLGLGRALLAELAAETVRRGFARLEWNVLDWNTPALGFYSRLGARPLADWTVHRLDGEALHALADPALARTGAAEAGAAAGAGALPGPDVREAVVPRTSG